MGGVEIDVRSLGERRVTHVCLLLSHFLFLRWVMEFSSIIAILPAPHSPLPAPRPPLAAGRAPRSP